MKKKKNKKLKIHKIMPISECEKPKALFLKDKLAIIEKNISDYFLIEHFFALNSYFF